MKTKPRNWWKRLFTLDYDEQLSDVLDLIEIHEVELLHTYDQRKDEQKTVLQITKRLDSVEDKMNAFNHFDYGDRFIMVQSDISKVAEPNSQISVAIDNINHAAYLRFGSFEAVDTVNAVWWISKTGNKISNDFGDVLDPWSPRLTVQAFLRMTSDKQGDTPLDDIVPPHTHPEYQDEIERLDKKIDNIDAGDGYDDAELREEIENNATAIAGNTAAISTNAESLVTNAAAIAENARKIDLNSAATGLNRVDIDANTEDIRENTFDIAFDDYRITDIEEFLGATPGEVQIAWGQWAWSSNPPPPSSPNACSDTLDIPEITQMWFNKQDLLSNDVTKWEATRPGDTIVVGKANDFDVTDTGTYLIKKFEVQNGQGDPSVNGSVYYMDVEFQTGSGTLQAGFGTRAEMRRNGMDFDDSSTQAKEYRLETDANLRGAPAIKLVGSDDNFSDVSFHAGTGLAITSQASALTVELSESFLSEHGQIDQNRQDIALIKGALSDKMEIELVLSDEWTYAGEDTTPRDSKFSTDNWFFDKATTLSVNKKGTSMSQDWDVVNRGDEVLVRYNEDLEQPVDERYFGKYIVRELLNTTGDILTVRLDFVDGMGTIVENKKYMIQVRGARIPDTGARTAAIVDMTDTFEQLDTQVTQNTFDVQDILNYLQASEVETDLGEAKWTYAANDGEYPSSEHCWSDTPDLTAVSLFMYKQTAHNATTVNWNNARAGDTFDVKLDYAEEANHGSYTITQFDVVNGSGEVTQLGGYYRIYVEPREGATNAGKLESGQFARSKILHYGKRFDFTPVTP